MTPPGELMYIWMGLRGVLVVEEQELGHDDVGHLVVDGRAQEDDALLEQQRIDVVGPLAAAAGLDDHGDEGLRG